MTIEAPLQIRTRDAIDAETFAHGWIEGVARKIGLMAQVPKPLSLHPMAHITNEGHEDNSRIMTLWMNGHIRAQATFVRDEANFTVAVLAEVEPPPARKVP